jgi:hypothetical protein
MHWVGNITKQKSRVVNEIFSRLSIVLPVTVAARSEALTVFASSNTGIVDSNLTRGMDVSVCLFCV